MSQFQSAIVAFASTLSIANASPSTAPMQSLNTPVLDQQKRPVNASYNMTQPNSLTALGIDSKTISANRISIKAMKAQRESGLKNSQLEDLAQRFQGPWYNAAQSGQGFLFNTGHSNGQYLLFGAWFTYSGDGSKKTWLSLQAPIVAGEYQLNAAIYETSGGRFNQPNQQGQVITKAIGGAILSYSPTDCQSMTLQFGITDPTFLSQNNLSPAQGQGTITLSRLLNAPATCGSTGGAPYTLDCRSTQGSAYNYTGTVYYPHETMANVVVGRTGFGYQNPNECQSAKEASVFSNQGAVCNWNGYNWMPYSVFGNDRGIGRTNYGYPTPAMCNDAVRASTHRAMCNWNGTGFSVYNILNGQYVGRDNNGTIYGFTYTNECNDTVQRANNGLVCTWVGDSWSIHEISSNRFIGTTSGNTYYGFNTASACQTSVARSTRTYVCNNDGTGAFKAFRLSNAQPTGPSFASISACWDSLPNLPN